MGNFVKNAKSFAGYILAISSAVMVIGAATPAFADNSVSQQVSQQTFEQINVKVDGDKAFSSMQDNQEVLSKIGDLSGVAKMTTWNDDKSNDVKIFNPNTNKSITVHIMGTKVTIDGNEVKNVNELSKICNDRNLGQAKSFEETTKSTIVGGSKKITDISAPNSAYSQIALVNAIKNIVQSEAMVEKSNDGTVDVTLIDRGGHKTSYHVSPDSHVTNAYGQEMKTMKDVKSDAIGVGFGEARNYKDLAQNSIKTNVSQSDSPYSQKSKRVTINEKQINELAASEKNPGVKYQPQRQSEIGDM